MALPDSASSNDQTTQEALKAHKELLKEKANKSTAKYLSQFTKMSGILNEILEENVFSSKELSKITNKIAKSTDSIAKSMLNLEKVMKDCCKSNPKTYVESLVDEFSDQDFFDVPTEALSGINESIAEMTDNMADFSESFSDNTVFADVGDGLNELSNNIGSIVDDMTGDEEPLDYGTSQSISESAERKSHDVEVLWKDRITLFLDNIDRNVQSIADHFNGTGIRKKGGTGNPTEDDGKDKKGSIWGTIASFLMFKQLRTFLKGVSKAMWKKLSGWTGKLVGWFGGVFKNVWKKIAGFGAKVGNKIAMFFKPVTKLISKLLSPVMKFLRPVISKMGKIMSPFMKFLGPIFKAISKQGLKAVPVIGQIWMAVTAIWDFFDGFGDEGAEELTGKAKELLTFWDKFKSGISSMISGLLFGLIDKKTVFGFVDRVGKSIEKVYKDFVSLIPGSWKKAGKYIMDAIDRGWESLKQGFSGILGKLPGLAMSAMDKVISFLTLGMADMDTVKVAGNAIAEFATMIGDKVRNLLKSITDMIPSSIKDFISSKVSDATGALSNLYDGAKDMVGLGDNTPTGRTATAPVVSKPEALNIETSRMTTKQAHEKRAPAESKGSTTNVVTNNTSGGKSSVNRSINTGRNDISRIIGGGRQFSFQ